MKTAKEKRLAKVSYKEFPLILSCVGVTSSTERITNCAMNKSLCAFVRDGYALPFSGAMLSNEIMK